MLEKKAGPLFRENIYGLVITVSTRTQSRKFHGSCSRNIGAETVLDGETCFSLRDEKRVLMLCGRWFHSDKHLTNGTFEMYWEFTTKRMQGVRSEVNISTKCLWTGLDGALDWVSQIFHTLAIGYVPYPYRAPLSSATMMASWKPTRLGHVSWKWQSWIRYRRGPGGKEVNVGKAGESSQPTNQSRLSACWCHRALAKTLQALRLLIRLPRLQKALPAVFPTESARVNTGRVKATPWTSQTPILTTSCSATRATCAQKSPKIHPSKNCTMKYSIFPGVCAALCSRNLKRKLPATPFCQSHRVRNKPS